LLEAFGVPLVGVEGYEADDVIGTLATRAAGVGFRVVIVSGDKDFYQLIGPNVVLLNPGRGGPAAVGEEWVGESNAGDRLGVPPARVVDYLALVGDTSDNIPGVKGVGDKTALELIQVYGDLDSILARAAEIPGKRAREALLAHVAEARLSRDLVTIRRDVPLPLEADALRLRPPAVPRLTELFTELEFRSLIPRLERLLGASPALPAPSATVPRAPRAPPVPPASSAPAAAAPPAAAGARIVDDAAGVAAILAECRAAPLVALDTETTSVDPLRATLVGMSLAVTPERSWYLPFGHLAPDGELAAGEPPRNLPPLSSPALAPLRALLADPRVPKAGHNVNYDWLVLRRHGVELAGVVYDAMLASFVLDPARRSHALAELARERLGIEMQTYVGLVGRGPISRQFARELAELEQTIHRAAGTDFNINSTPQLRHILFDKLQLPVLKKTKTGASTDFEVLEQLAALGHEVPRLLIEYRELAKLKSTYVDALPGYVNPATGRIHTSFNQAGAATGRLSSSDPNLQNIPVRTPRGEAIRRAFVAAPGWLLLTADYSQIELRLLAHLSGDPAFLHAFAQGGDIHRQTAAIIFGVSQDQVTPDMRARAKTINFATIYGQ